MLPPPPGRPIAEPAVITPRTPVASLAAYFTAVVITVLAITSQYFLPQSIPALLPAYESYVGGYLIVYGIPIVAFALAVGANPLRRFAYNMRRATVEGLTWYALLSLLMFFVLFGMIAVYEALDPAALDLLTRPNPVIQAAEANPWFWVAFSFVVGAVEETIFRGWMFGYWLTRSGSSWILHATWTSIVFAGVHLYYGITYGPASPLIYPGLFFLGFAFAGTFRYSGGNLVVVALLHGVYDASGFLTLISPEAGNVLRYGLVGVGAVLALILYIRQTSSGRKGSLPTGSTSSPLWFLGQAPSGTPAAVSTPGTTEAQRYVTDDAKHSVLSRRASASEPAFPSFQE